MKTHFLYLLIFTLIAAPAMAQIPLVSYINTNGSAKYPTHLDSLGYGGFRVAKDTAERNAITTLRRKYGMAVYVQSNDSLYILRDHSLGNTNWFAFAPTGGTVDLSGYMKYSDTSTILSPYLLKYFGVKYSDTASMLSGYSRKGQSLQLSDTAAMLTNYGKTGQTLKYTDTSAMLQTRLKFSDTATMLNGYLRLGGMGNINGNASTATQLQTGRNINGVLFTGTVDITVPASASTLTSTTLAPNVVNSSLTSLGTLSNLTVTSLISGSVTGTAATVTNPTQSAITSLGTLSGLTVSTPINGGITGNSATATKLTTPRNINGVAFDGSSNITITALADASTLSGTILASNVMNSSLTSLGTLTNLTVTNPIAGSVTGTAATVTNPTQSAITSLGTLSGLTVTAPISGNITGNSATATKLATPRNINGVAFDGSINITISPIIDAATLTGTTLAGNVTKSSLTSLGTLSNLTVTGPIAGSVAGTSATVTNPAQPTITSVGNLTGLTVTNSLQLYGIHAGATTDSILTISAGVVKKLAFTAVSSSTFSVPYVYSNGTSLGIGNQSLIAPNTGTGNVAYGDSTLYQNTTGFSNTAIGTNSLLLNTIGTRNTAIGIAALYSNTMGVSNTAIGDSALNYNNAGGSNTATGFMSLLKNITGNSNTAYGVNSMMSNSSGGNNTGIGLNSLSSTVSGSNGVAVGYQSQSRQNNTATPWTNTNTSVGYQSLIGSSTASNNTGLANTAIGYQSLMPNTSGSKNTAIGDSTMLSNTTGSENIAVGHKAGASNTIGSWNISIGKNAGYTDGTVTTPSNLSNVTAIGYNAQVTASNSFILGGIGIYAVKVGIGVSAPNSTLFVNGSIGSAIIVDPSGTLTDTHHTVILNNATSIALPDPTTTNGREYIIVNRTAIGQTIGTYSNIAGTTSTTVPAKTSVTLQSDGVLWYQLK
jgi:hypothetical protein